jgi:1-acyl-sn-glycerol-3-phosphate acyltransferase
LADGARIGLAPGGIAEMFEGYPKPGTHPDEEYVIINSRKGFIRLAIKHGVPVVPVFCFGVTKMLKRLQLPALFEQVSNLLRVSICIFYGAWGLPIPFRQKLLYVMGDPMFPPTPSGDEAALNQQVDLMHSEFCNKLTGLFERHKRSYGWDRKTLKLI